MKKISLTKGFVALVDDEDYDFLTQWKWRLKGGYAARSMNLGRVNGKQRTKTIFMHRVIMNTPDGMETDHSDLDKLNNQRNKLRICSASENRQNRPPQCNNKHNAKGVSLRKGKWHASIVSNKKRINLGTFDSFDKARDAYNNAAILHHGAFARLNK